MSRSGRPHCTAGNGCHQTPAYFVPATCEGRSLDGCRPFINRMGSGARFEASCAGLHVARLSGARIGLYFPRHRLMHPVQLSSDSSATPRAAGQPARTTSPAPATKQQAGATRPGGWCKRGVLILDGFPRCRRIALARPNSSAADTRPRLRGSCLAVFFRGRRRRPILE